MITWLIFFAILGACVGSFLNVVVYRIPRGLSVVSPPSACPKCEHKLAWHDNVPVLGWIWLKGKCRYCKNPISSQYPIVEAISGLLFAGWYAACYMSDMQPGFSGPGFNATWLTFIATLVLLGGMISATIIDARMFIIPLSICWIITIAGGLLCATNSELFPKAVRTVPLQQTLIQTKNIPLHEIPPPYKYDYHIENKLKIQQSPKSAIVSPLPIVSTPTAIAGIAGILGLIISLILMKLKILPRSFDEPLTDEEIENWPDNPAAVRQLPIIIAPLFGAGIASAYATSTWRGGWEKSDALIYAAIGIFAGYIIVLAIMTISRKWLLTPIEPSSDSEQDTDHNEQLLPLPGNVRLEMLKELIFIAIPITTGILAMNLLSDSFTNASNLFNTLGGIAFGYLIGCATVWGTRIGGSLLFNKEAMGLGDVHLMGAVGAICGWEVAVMAFFLAPFFGLVYAMISVGCGKMFQFSGHQIPYGPHLAVSTCIIMLWQHPVMAAFPIIFN